MSRKFKFFYIQLRITGNLHENIYKFFIIPLSFLLKMRNVTVKYVGKITTHILCSVTFSPKSCRL